MTDSDPFLTFMNGLLCGIAATSVVNIVIISISQRRIQKRLEALRREYQEQEEGYRRKLIDLQNYRNQ